MDQYVIEEDIPLKDQAQEVIDSKLEDIESLEGVAKAYKEAIDSLRSIYLAGQDGGDWEKSAKLERTFREIGRNLYDHMHEWYKKHQPAYEWPYPEKVKAHNRVMVQSKPHPGKNIEEVQRAKWLVEKREVKLGADELRRIFKIGLNEIGPEVRSASLKDAQEKRATRAKRLVDAFLEFTGEPKAWRSICREAFSVLDEFERWNSDNSFRQTIIDYIREVFCPQVIATYEGERPPGYEIERILTQLEPGDISFLAARYKVGRHFKNAIEAAHNRNPTEAIRQMKGAERIFRDGGSLPTGGKTAEVFNNASRTAHNI